MPFNLSISNQRYLLIILSAFLFIPFIGNLHLFDWDEINFAECAREMIVTEKYLTVQIDFQPFWEKPPLFIWMQVCCMKLFGISEFAARLPNALCGIATLLFLFETGRKLYDNAFAWLWIMVYACSVLPFFYFKSGIIDPWFNLFIFSGIYFLIRFIASDQTRHKLSYIAASALCTGLAILTKGPVALLVIGLTTGIFILSQYRKFSFSSLLKNCRTNLWYVLFFLSVLSFVAGLWFFIQYAQGNGKLVHDFIVYQMRLFQTKGAGHGGFFGYHFVVLFFGVFPASIFALPALFKITGKDEKHRVFNSVMLILFWVVLILFSIVKTKIVHYSSLCYFPLTFLATVCIYNQIKDNTPFTRLQKTLLLAVTSFFALVLIALQLIVVNKSKIITSGLIKDKFAEGNLQATVYWSGFEFIIGVLLFSAVLVFIYYKGINLTTRFVGIFISTIIFINLILFIIVPRIEKYSQNAAIEFYKLISTENCYIQTYGFKSYAQLFYFKKPAPQVTAALNESSLLTGPSDKPVYIVCKNVSSKEFVDKHPDFKKLYEKNGFVFFVKEGSLASGQKM